MLHNSLEDLEPETRRMAEEFFRRCEEAGLMVLASETLRDPETQAVYFLRGRIPTDSGSIAVLQHLGGRYAWHFTESECKRKVTNTLNSYHLTGRAMDIEIYVNGLKSWDFDGPEWTRALQIARDVGFECGADWRNADYPHLQNTGVNA
jgi:hypothetical protein